MQKVLGAGWLLLIALASPVRASEFKIDGIAIDVPEKFEGPAVAAQPDARARTYAFSVRTTTPLQVSPILQISVYAAAEVRAGRSGDLSQRYLSQMLAGIERRRTDYRQSAVKTIRLAGLPGSAATWQGKANGIDTIGEMFCVIVKTQVLFFHVMGLGSMPNADMAAAIKAVENARQY